MERSWLSDRDLAGDRRHAPAAARNVGPIGDVLAAELPASGLVLEVASGTGEHAIAFAARFPVLEWQPSDPDPLSLRSIAAWIHEAAQQAGLSNIRAPVALDAAAEPWSISHADALLCINMVHISPWEATLGLMRSAGRLLAAGAPLLLYGPYEESGVETAPSNLAFDRQLKMQDARFGLRSIEAMDEAAAVHGLSRAARYQMPANNLMLVYRKV